MPQFITSPYSILMVLLLYQLELLTGYNYGFGLFLFESAVIEELQIKCQVILPYMCVSMWLLY